MADTLRSTDAAVVFGVASNPTPEHTVRHFHANGTMVQANAHRPELVNLLEMERWMPRVRLEHSKRPVGQFLHGEGKCSVTYPEIWGSAMNHNSVERPAS
jgi:hypothetical protein